MNILTIIWIVSNFPRKLKGNQQTLKAPVSTPSFRNQINLTKAG